MIYLSEEELYDLKGNTLEEVKGLPSEGGTILVVESVMVKTYYIDRSLINSTLERDFVGDKFLFSVDELSPGKIQVYSMKQSVMKKIRETFSGEVFPYYLALKTYRKKNVPENVVLFLEKVGNKAIITPFIKEEIFKPRVINCGKDEDIDTEITRSLVGLKSSSEKATIYSNIDFSYSASHMIGEVKISAGSFSLKEIKNLSSTGKFLLPEEIEHQQKKAIARSMRKRFIAVVSLSVFSLALLFSIYLLRLFYIGKTDDLIKEKQLLEIQIKEEFSKRYGSVIAGKDIKHLYKCYKIMDIIPPGYIIYSLTLSDTSGEIVVGPEKPIYYIDLPSYIRERSSMMGLENVSVSELVSANTSFLIKF